MGTNPTLHETGATVDATAQQKFLWNTHEHLNESARFADTKAAFAGTFASALLGALYSAKAHVPMVTTSYHQWSSATWLAVGAGLLLCVSVGLSVWTVLPRLGTPEKGFIYWGSIAAYCSLDQLQKSFHSQTAHELNDHLLRDIFVLSTRVCIPKYRAVLGCIWAEIGSFLLLLSARL